MKKIVAALLSLLLVLTSTGLNILSSKSNQVSATESESSEATLVNTVSENYKIYPIPQEIQYQEGVIVLNKPLVLIKSDSVDAATIARLDETLAIKGLKYEISTEPKEGAINIYLASNKESDSVYNTVKDSLALDASKMSKTDAYFLKIAEDNITVIGSETDAIFYGLTTLYHIIKQSPDLTLRKLTIYDFANIKSRGFIEGYYGNPWSVDDRVDLMHFGGYYKQNVYFYAPKDDPKHRVQWDTLYTETELESIRRLAEAGNQSKTRFVYALHPLSGSNQLRFDSTNYPRDLQKLKDKFMQVIRQGVRQISILADDFVNPGGPNGLKLVTDVTNWLKNEVRQEFPDMKITLPYVPYDYMGMGNSAEHRSLRNAPENVQIVMTGGRVWGEVSKSFTDTFKNNTNRGPFLWINWPCSDNSKNHLILGGQEIFLHPDVNPDNVEGIMLNPMQQSEASKVAIFAGACYEWNIYQDQAEGEQVWHDSFTYVDHNGAYDTTGSIALRELARHMKNQNMPTTKVRPIEESQDLAPLLQAIKTKLTANDVISAEEIDAVRNEFLALEQHALNYEKYKGNERTYTQIKYWIDSFKDTTKAAINYLDALKAYNGKATQSMLDKYSRAKAAFAQSRTHGFRYLDHTEYAEVGVQHIVPFIRALDEYLAANVKIALNPDAIVTRYITSRTDAPFGNTADVLDNNPATGITYKTPSTISEGTYVGLTFNKPVVVENLKFILGGGKNHFDHGKLQYLDAENQWQDWTENDTPTEFSGELNKVQKIQVAFKQPKEVKGVRFYATRNNALDAWLEVMDLAINTELDMQEEILPLAGTVSLEGISVRNNVGLDKLTDGNTSSNSEVFLAKEPYVNPNRDTIPENAKLIFTLAEPKVLKKVHLYQGQSAAGDILNNAVLEYQLAGSETWSRVGSFQGTQHEEWNITEENPIAKIRVVNQVQKAVWWRVSEIQAFDKVAKEENLANISYRFTTPQVWTVYRNNVGALTDNNPSSYIWYNVHNGDHYNINDALTLDLQRPLYLKELNIIVGADNGDKFRNYAIEYSEDGRNYLAVPGFSSYQGKDNGSDIHKIKMRGQRARYVRVRSLERRHSWVKFSEFTVKATENFAGTDTYIVSNTSEKALGREEATFVTINPTTYTMPANTGELGFDLKNIKDIKATLSFQSTANLKVEHSLDTVTWTELPASSFTDEASRKSLVLPKTRARYIRIVNKDTTPATLELSEFRVDFPARPIKSVSSDFGMGSAERDVRSKGNVGDAFDNNLETYIEITGVQDPSKEIVFDLGQTIDFKSFRYYISEANRDFLRSADFKVREEGQDNWTTILSINPDSVENTANEDVAKNYALLTHDTKNPGNMYAEATNLNVRGRYLKIQPKYAYNHRWVQINELMINNGEYLSKEWNSDFTSSHVEKPNHLPTFAIDKDNATSYIMDSENGSITYRISEPNVKALRIISLARPATNNVTFVAHSGREINFGSLTQTVEEIVLPENETLKEVRFTYEGGNLELLEIFPLDKTKLVAVNKQELIAELAKEANENWTAVSKKKYNEARARAEQVVASDYVTQSMVESALFELVRARAEAKEGIATDELKSYLVNPKTLNKEDIPYYTLDSFLPYQDYLNRLAGLLANEEYEWTLDEVGAYKAAYERLVANLKYSQHMAQLAQTVVEDMEHLYLEEDYSQASWQAFKTALVALKDALKDAANQDPLQIRDLTNTLKQKAAGLINISSLKEAIEAEIVESNYTEASLQAYKEALNTAKEISKTATDNEQVARALADLKAKKDSLVPKTPVDQNLLDTLSAILARIKELKAEDYTEASLAKLQEQALQVTRDNVSQEKIEKLLATENSLVSIKALRKTVADIEKLSAEKYTTDSYNALVEKMASSELDPLYQNGTPEAIADKIQELLDLKGKLKVRVEEAEYADYMKKLVEYPAALYSQADYAPYLTALNNLKNIEQTLANVSLEDFAKLKSEYEKALAELMKKEVQSFVTASSNGQELKDAVITVRKLSFTDATLPEEDKKMQADVLAKVKESRADLVESDLDYYEITHTSSKPDTPVEYTITLPTDPKRTLKQVIHIKDINDGENGVEIIDGTNPTYQFKEDKKANFVSFKVNSLSPFLLVYEKPKKDEVVIDIIGGEELDAEDSKIADFAKLINSYSLGLDAKQRIKVEHKQKDKVPATAAKTTKSTSDHYQEIAIVMLIILGAYISYAKKSTK